MPVLSCRLSTTYKHASEIVYVYIANVFECVFLLCFAHFSVAAAFSVLFMLDRFRINHPAELFEFMLL